MWEVDRKRLPRPTDLSLSSNAMGKGRETPCPQARLGTYTHTHTHLRRTCEVEYCVVIQSDPKCGAQVEVVFCSFFVCLFVFFFLAELSISFLLTALAALLVARSGKYSFISPAQRVCARLSPPAPLGVALLDA